MQLYKKEFVVSDVNFLLFDEIKSPMYLEVKTRYSAKSHKAKLIREKNDIRVIFDEPQKSITPGQSAVFYDNDIVIGGGKIVTVQT